MQHRLVNAPAAHRARAAGDGHASAAAPPSPTLLGAAARSSTSEPVHVYGLTETYGPPTVCEWHARVGRAARGRAGAAARAPGRGLRCSPTSCASSTTTMNDVPRDGETMGEVVMRGNNVMKGYYDEPEPPPRRSAAAGSTPATSAVMHPDGYIELRDRKKDIIISGGENISTIEVEQARRPPPRGAGVRGRRHPATRTWGERPKAFVTLKPGQQRHRAGDHRVLPRAASRTSSAPPRSSSASCRRPRPARCRSSCCAIKNGAGAKSASTER